MINEDAVRFGTWFKGRREQAGFKTKAEFLRSHAVVGASALSQVEAGKLSVALDTALSLGRAVGASDLETLAAMGEIGGITPADVELLQRIGRLEERDRRVVSELVGIPLRE